MKYRRHALSLSAFLLSLVAAGTVSGQTVFIDWAGLTNPVLDLPDRAFKDAAVVYEDGWFYFFGSNRFEANDPETFRERMSFCRARDLITYEPFFDSDLIVDDHGAPAFPESPDLVRINRTWNMVFQSRRLDREHYRLYLSTSQDLMDWSPAVEIAPANKPEQRQIDGALAREDGAFYLGYKGKLKFYMTRSQGPELGSWARRTDKTRLAVPVEDWNRVMTANSAYLCDWRGHDGFFYLFYAGGNDDYMFQSQGHAKIGVSRSRDLVAWKAAGDMSD